jgi:hypothetical protein
MSKMTTQFLSSNNENKVKNHIMTELSREFNIQPMIKTIDDKIVQIMRHINGSVGPINSQTPQQNLDRLNKIVIDQCIDGFRKTLKPYALNNRATEQKNDDVKDQYAKLMKERDYTNVVVNNIESVRETIVEPSDDSSLYNDLLNNYIEKSSGLSTSLSSIPEEIPANDRRNSFQQRIVEMRMNRNKMIEERNQIDLERIKKNEAEQLGEKADIKYNSSNDLESQPVVYDTQNRLANVGTPLLQQSEIQKYRYAEYKDDIKYRSMDRQFIVHSKDRKWYGDVENNTLTTGTEVSRYMFGVNCNKQIGIYLQNRQKNVSAIRIVNVYISMNELDSSESAFVPPYLYVYIPELENRIETSSVNRKFVFAVLTLDDRINGQLKYVNFVSANYYLTNPIADLSNMTIEILNPMGFLYSDAKDNLKIVGMTVNDTTSPKYIILTLDKFIRKTQYAPGDTALIKNYGTGTNDSFTVFMNRENGHFIRNNPSTNEFVQELYIDVPLVQAVNGLYSPPQYFLDIVANIAAGNNPYATTQGNIIDVNLQPVVLFEISKLEPDPKGMRQNNITLI